MNKITLDGRLGRDAETKYLQDGTALLVVSIASDIGYGDKKTTMWFNGQIYGKRAESLAQYLVKGTQVTVYGSLTLREWQTKEGVKQISPDVRIDEITLHKAAEQKSNTEQIARAAKNAQKSDPDDDIPF